MITLLRYRDLKARGIVASWALLRIRIARDGFPEGRLLGPNCRVWTESEIEEWIASRPTAKKPAPRRKAKAAAEHTESST